MRENLQKAGLHGRIRRKVPFIDEPHRDDRLAWARSVSDWTHESWQRVIFSDECKFNLFGSDGKSYCRRYDGDALLPQFTIKTIKGRGGKINVWGCITSRGVGKLIRVEGNLEQVQYSTILAEGVCDTLKMHDFDLEDIIWQQDNDPKHTSGLAYDYYFGNEVPLLHWAARSPDMNILEHCWHHLKHKVDLCGDAGEYPKNEDELWRLLEREWYAIDLDFINALYGSMTRRVQALIDVDGWNTRY